MKFFDKFKKNHVVLSAKKEETKYKKYTVSEMDEIGNKFYDEVIQKIGKGEFKVGYNLGEYPKFYAVLYLDKNTLMFNSLFRDLFWSHDSLFRTLIRNHEGYENMIFDLKYGGFVEICKEIAKDHEITVELTDWSVENIVISYDEKEWSSWYEKCVFNNKKTLADYAREKCFAW